MRQLHKGLVNRVLDDPDAPRSNMVPSPPESELFGLDEGEEVEVEEEEWDLDVLDDVLDLVDDEDGVADADEDGNAEAEVVCDSSVLNAVDDAAALCVEVPSLDVLAAAALSAEDVASEDEGDGDDEGSEEGVMVGVPAACVAERLALAVACLMDSTGPELAALPESPDVPKTFGHKVLVPCCAKKRPIRVLGNALVPLH